MDQKKPLKATDAPLQKLDEGEILRTLIDLIPDPILIKDRKGRYILVNQAKLRELAARGFKDVIGKTAFDFFDRAQAERFKEDDDRVLKTGEPLINYREKILTPNGTFRWHLTSKIPWRNNQNTIVGFMSISRDVTELVEAEDKLQAERNLLRTLIDNMPDCIYAKDAQGRKIVANPGDLKNLGCHTEAEAVGRTDFDFFPRDIAQRFFDAEQQVVREGKSLVNQEEKVVRPDGEARWILTTKVPWRDAEGRILGLVGIGRDITEKKNLEAQVAQAQRMESMGRLATGVAHDLNNILAPLLISIELLRKKMQDEESAKMLAKAEANAKRGADIIRQMLWFSRGLSGQRTPVDLRQLIDEVSRYAGETFGKSIRIKKVIAKDLWPVVGDLAQLHQVLMNLCTNARDAMPNGGNLTFTASNAVVDGQRFAVIELRDTGAGMEPEVMDRIFEPFFTTKEVGHGLGLSTAASIAKSHGGFIRVNSEPSLGSVFRVHLPVQA